MQRVKNIHYDEDDLYDEEDEEEYDAGYDDQDAETQENYANLTPVVRAELNELGLQASDREIHAALWDSYWDVGESVGYLKTRLKPKATATAGGANEKKAKAKTRFDEAAEKAGQAPLQPQAMVSPDWFDGVPWINPNPDIVGKLSPAMPPRTRPKLLGGSSKLAKLAEERRKRNAAPATSPAATSTEAAIGSLDLLSQPKHGVLNDGPASPAVGATESRKYPFRKKREPTPPPRQPTPPPPPPPAECVEEKPDLRAEPSEFARVLTNANIEASSPTTDILDQLMGYRKDMLTAFNGPSPDDVVTRAQAHRQLAPKQTSAKSLEQTTKNLSLEDNQQSAPPRTNIRSKNLNVPKLWEEQRPSRKQSAAFVVIGHVDHGKSTLMGRLLLDTGAVAQRDVEKYRKAAAAVNKSSFALAWVMDTDPMERERGVTVDIAQHHFSTAAANFTVLDAPGHRDFVPNMLAGASMADLAILVVDAMQLESGMKGQTREHVLLAKAIGLKRMVVALNKMDGIKPQPWSKQAFESVQAELLPFLKGQGWSEEALKIVPCSGLSGDNVVNPPKSADANWVTQDGYPTLLQALEQSIPPEPPIGKIRAPFRMQISDVFRASITNPLAISGRITFGSVQTGDVILVQPSSETAIIKGIEIGTEPKDFAVTGQIAILHLQDIDPLHLRSGDIACDPKHPVPLRQTFGAQIEAQESLLPQATDVHFGRLHVPGRISKLVEIVGEGSARRKPRIVKEGQRARVVVAVDESAETTGGLARAGVPVEQGQAIVLRAQGVTIAYGAVEGD